MTARQILEGVLIERNKVNAPSLLLEDFNYFINKTIYQYINKRYNIYETNQQTTDDLSRLKGEANLKPIEPNSTNNVTAKNSLYGAVCEFILPNDYYHLLNCVCNFKVNKKFKCYEPGTYVQFPAIKLTSDAWPMILTNVYMKPSYKRPYYYIHNVNTNEGIPTNPNTGNTLEKSNGTDMDGYYDVTIQEENEIDIIDSIALNGGRGSNLPRKMKVINGDSSREVSLVEKEAGLRYGNPSNIRMEIRFGKDSSVFELDSIQVDYLKTPQYILLTQEQLDLTEDTSQIIEFPDYVCQEIINELVTVLMENDSDPRIQTYPIVSKSIAEPTQAQTPVKRK